MDPNQGNQANQHIVQAGPAPEPRQSARTVVVEKLKTAESILVAVSANPSVDQLAAALALTITLNKIKKNTTAVFSGKIPSTIEFLKPDETFRPTTDGLRDFIISLDKSKADKLRYKIEDDVVKIFITPYRTNITESDLKYSAGDFNVDLILALGVQHQVDLDTAITSHGRIFHDAVTVCINNQPGGDFGIANWEDVQASSLSELISGLVQDLGPSLLDKQVATALLTGIVAETARFSNAKTHPDTMTVASMLLEAGADQQLVNKELQDEIGSVIQLKAGDEVKPTAPPEQATAQDTGPIDIQAPDPDELIISENGDIKLPDGEPAMKPAPAAAVAPAAVKADAPAAAEPTEAPAVKPLEDSNPLMAPPATADDGPHIEKTKRTLLTQPPASETETPSPGGEPADAVNEPAAPQAAAMPAPATVPAPEAPAPEPEQTAPAESVTVTPAEPVISSAPPPSTTPGLEPDLELDQLKPVASQDEARKAVENALGAALNNSAHPSAPPSPAMPAAAPAPEAPSAPLPDFTPANEPPPLANSPADQTFTMPMPPSGAPGNPSSPAQLWDGPAGTAPAAGSSAPPPLPPPILK